MFHVNIKWIRVELHFFIKSTAYTVCREVTICE